MQKEYVSGRLNSIRISISAFYAALLTISKSNILVGNIKTYTSLSASSLYEFISFPAVELLSRASFTRVYTKGIIANLSSPTSPDDDSGYLNDSFLARRNGEIRNYLK